jgi:hypothetical protein
MREFTIARRHLLQGVGADLLLPGLRKLQPA